MNDYFYSFETAIRWYSIGLFAYSALDDIADENNQ